MTLNGPGVFFQERELVGGEFSRLPQPRADCVSGAALPAAAGAFPFDRHAVGDEALDGIRHVGEPGAAAHLAVAEDVEADLALLFERAENRAVLGGAEVVESELALRIRGAGLQEFGRAQQTADVFSAIACGHGETRYLRGRAASRPKAAPKRDSSTARSGPEIDKADLREEKAPGRSAQNDTWARVGDDKGSSAPRNVGCQ